MEPHKPTRGLRAYATGVQLPHPATASLGLSHPPLAARGLLAPALAILSSLSTLGSVKDVAGTPRARRYCCWTGERGWASWRVVSPTAAAHCLAPQTRSQALSHQAGAGTRSGLDPCCPPTALWWPSSGSSSGCLGPRLAAGLRPHRPRRPSSPSAHAPPSCNPVRGCRTR